MPKKSKKTEEKSAPKKPKKKYWLWGIAVVLVLGLGGGTVGAYQITKLPEENFVHILYGHNIDFTRFSSFEEVAEALQKSTDAFLSTPTVFDSDRGTLTIALKDAGVSVDTRETFRELQNFMSASGFEKIRAFFFGKEVKLPLTIDDVALKTAFEGTGIEQGVKNASFAKTGNTVSVEAEQVGYGIDTITLSADIEKVWEKGHILEATTLPLLTSEPTVTTAELTPLLAQAQTAAGVTFNLTDDYGNNYELALSDHLDWLIPGSANVFGLQQEKFISTVQNELAEDLEEDPQGVVITQNTDGTYSFEGSARFGQKIDTLALADTLETTLQTVLTTDSAASEQATTLSPITIPITRTLPLVTVPDSLKALGVTDLVGVGYSDFSGSPSNRIHNITEGINQFNGVLIQKDEEFSFMEHLSPVDAEHGFLPELVIKGDETIPEYGGGMCQVSSTMFRAALYSGLPITARTNHSYAVSYYARPFGYGLDATVYDPAPDLKFLNDTPGALLVQSYIEGNSAYYVFYGTNDGRRVSMDGPYAYDYRSIPADVITYVDSLAPGERELTDHGHQGFKVDWTRTITRADGTQKTETIHSNYEARPERWNEGKTPEAE